MPNEIIEFAKQHPVGTAVGVFIVGVGLVLYYHSNSSSPASTTQPTGYDPQTDPAVIAANAGLTESQNQLAAYTTNSNNQLAANGQNTAAAVQIATLQTQQSTNHDQIAADSATTIAALQEKLGELTSTLSATVSEANINAQVTNNTNNNLAATTINQQNTNEVLALTQSNNSALESIIKFLNPPPPPPPPPALYTSGYTGTPSNPGVFASTVENDYQKVLGRTSYNDPNAQYWVNQLSTGNLTAAQLLSDVQNSPEAMLLHTPGVIQ